MDGYQNLEDVLNLSTDRERFEGTFWYVEAAKFSEALADRCGLNKDIVVGIIAALSPRCPWKENVIEARDLIRSRGKSKTITYKSNKKKALAILRGVARPEDILNGHKVRAFFFNISDPENSTEVCIDTHMICCWFNKSDLGKAFLNTVFHPRGSRRNTIQEIKEAIISLAHKYHLRPLQIQAIIWITWKRLTENKAYSSKVEYQAILQETEWLRKGGEKDGSGNSRNDL